MKDFHAGNLRCSIVIRAYNEEEYIGRLLSGIKQQTVSDVEIILVDSGSTDATVEIGNQYQAQVVEIAPQDFTFGRALNYGVAAASGEFIVVASAHVYPLYPDWLEKLLEPFADPQVAMTYGKQRGNAQSKFSEQQLFHQWFPEASVAKQMHPFCNNANDAIRRNLWEKQPYDESLTGLEDLAWAHWAISQGNSVSYVAEAEIVHVHEEKPRQVLNRFRREAMAFKRIFPQEIFRLRTVLRLYITNVLNDVRDALNERVIFSSLTSILWFRWMQFWGTYLGYRHSGPLTERLRWVFYYPPSPSKSKRKPARDVPQIDYGEHGKKKG